MFNFQVGEEKKVAPTSSGQSQDLRAQTDELLSSLGIPPASGKHYSFVLFLLLPTDSIWNWDSPALVTFDEAAKELFWQIDAEEKKKKLLTNQKDIVQPRFENVQNEFLRYGQL